ncbi:MAG: adenylate/guanylate cyclase domain-containing protein [Rhodospirillaceae bacterium]|nr:adenylate/guanylate cyclase domain-containing protein [Rhodospirillaceae bacterium]
MSRWTDLRLPAAHEMLIGFYDLTGYTVYSASHEPRDILELMAGYFHLTGRIIAESGGRLIKTLGDAGLCAFFAEDTDAGVRALRRVQHDGDAWLLKQGYKSRAVVKMHLGPVALGLVGAPGTEILDVYGKTVNTAAVLQSNGFALSPAAFRGLKPETRTLFKKHTPPISYIASEDRHS